MVPGPHHQISNLETSPGELSFDATIDGKTQRIWFRTETEVEPYAEAALAAALMPAMRSGGTLAINDPISARVLRTQREFQAVQRAWSLDWAFEGPPLQEVEVTAPARIEEQRPPTGRVAAFFSGGVDSWATILGEPDVTDLVFVRGVDILTSTQGEEFADRVEARLRSAAAELGLPLHVVSTNLRELSEPLLPWETCYGCAMAAVALFVGGEFDRILIAGDSDYEVQEKFGANWMVDQLWSNEALEIVDAGGRFSRVERTERIASHPAVQQSLRVCWLNPEGAYNCGACRKCWMTMATLEAFDALEAVETFPSRIDLDQLASLGLPHPVLLHLWEDVLDAVRRSGKRDLERVVAGVVSRSKRDLGLPQSYRRRAAPAPPLPGEVQPAGPEFLVDPETAAAIAGAGAVAFLVGGYDGSGNYGDIALLDAALALLGGLDPGLLALPVVERQFASTHEAIAGEIVNRPRHVLYFDEGGGGKDGLVPVTPPKGLNLGVSYLYGGGFLNPSWGERKLAMLRAVEALLAEAETVTRVASGLQVDAGWIAGLDPADKALLRGFELLGARDDASVAGLEQLGGGSRVTNTGDDAVGLLGELAPAEGEEGEVLEVNVHFAEHDWVTDRPDAVRDFDVGLLAELSNLSGRKLRVRPLLAYFDPRIDESAGVERFSAACEERGFEVGEPRVLRPANVAAVAAEMRAAALTVSCSFHVALTSLLLGLPTVLLNDTGYYGQKATGLLSDFDLPDAFAPRSTDDPQVVAAAIAPHLSESATRQRLAAAGSRVRRRRIETEADLLGAIARGGLRAVGEPAPPPADEAEVTDAAAAEAPAVDEAPAEAQAPAVAEDGAAAEARAAEAERRAAEANAQLGVLLGSTSWKVTAPLRRLTRRLRGS